ncbi:lipid-A-disaccharide synthase N-terminal domain-containing protein [Natronoflexus pectinivorans]|uniref:Lipid A biosynthesis-like protein n=1 Tax=Natronoflexus pectinivorans TaxID=682526 RepID=A0A4R2GDD0_9BACT|nr:lipid-A-disaccharide synthase N-terminal domain-containing protein [Natronoflexus pectinivorans]TCO06067.1 lipid A biosynthesis-like protein [Natronoflexus pectinivorans]
MIPVWLVISIGFTAQFLFSARTFYQWFASERKKKVVAPKYFWQLSLFASFLLFAYGYFREDFTIMLGQAITYFIYIRNLQILGEWKFFPKLLRTLILVFPLMVIAWFNFNSINEMDMITIRRNIPLALFFLGITAQVLFTFRFVYQWIYCEVTKVSHLPLGFWLISLSGSLLIMIYGILRQDVVLIAGHLFGSVVYIRNLMLLRKEWLKESKKIRC